MTSIIYGLNRFFPLLLSRGETMKLLYLCLPVLLAVTLPLRANVNRAFSIEAPTEVDAGSTVSVTVKASTDASDGEQIGFLHSEYSTDEGLTWTTVFYLEASGAEHSRKFSFKANTKSGKAIVRARVDFRGGVAGDVDYWGGVMQWDRWEKWLSPATKYAIIYVQKP